MLYVHIVQHKRKIKALIKIKQDEINERLYLILSYALKAISHIDKNFNKLK